MLYYGAEINDQLYYNKLKLIKKKQMLSVRANLILIMTPAILSSDNMEVLQSIFKNMHKDLEDDKKIQTDMDNLIMGFDGICDKFESESNHRPL